MQLTDSDGDKSPVENIAVHLDPVQVAAAPVVQSLALTADPAAGSTQTLTTSSLATTSITGSTGADVFQVGPGDTTITGNGGGDTFVFKPGFGNAVITDFHVATTTAPSNPHDTIELDHAMFAQYATVADLLSSKQVAQVGTSVVITQDATDTITLQNVALKTLLAHTDDFHLV